MAGESLPVGVGLPLVLPEIAQQPERPIAQTAPVFLLGRVCLLVPRTKVTAAENLRANAALVRLLGVRQHVSLEALVTGELHVTPIAALDQMHFHMFV